MSLVLLLTMFCSFSNTSLCFPLTSPISLTSSWVPPCWNFPWNLALLLVPFPRGEKINHLTVWCQFKSYCRRLVRLDGQIVFKKSSFRTAKYQTICSSKNLFVPFSHQTICPSETICPSSSVKTANDDAQQCDWWHHHFSGLVCVEPVSC